MRGGRGKATLPADLGNRVRIDAGAGVETLMSSSAFGNARFCSEGMRCQGVGVLK